MTITDPTTPPMLGSPTPLAGFPQQLHSYTNITPFTYRSGLNYQEVLEGLRAWLRDILVPHVDDEFTEFTNAWNQEVTSLVSDVNTALSTWQDTSNTAIQDMVDYVNTEVANIVGSTIAVTDPVTLAIFNNLASTTRVAMDAQYGTKAKQDDTALIIPAGSTSAQAQAILTAATSGATVRLGRGADIVAPAGGFTLANDNILIDLAGGRITQPLWPVPAFDLIGRNGITIRGGTIEFTGVAGAVAGTIRGSANYVSSAGVWSNGDRIYVLDNTIKNFVCGVFLSSWDGNVLNGKYSNACKILRNDISGHNFGVLYTAQNKLRIRENYFHDDVDLSAGANPTHSIYGSSTTSVRSTDVQWIDNKTYNHTHGQAYQGKYDDKLVIRNATADTVSGLFNCIDCHDMDIDGMRSTDDIGFGTSGSFSMQSTDLVSQRPRIKNIDIKYRDSINSRPFLIIGQDGKMDRLTATINPSATYNGAIFDVRGDNMEMFNCDGTNNNPAVTVIGVLVNVGPTATNATIRGGKMKNVTNVVQLGAGTNGARINMDSTIQLYTGSFISAPAGVDYSTKEAIAAGLSTMGEHATLNALAKDTLTHTTANSAIQVKVRPSRDIQISNLYWYCITAAGNYDIAVYDDASNVPLWTKGSTPAPATGLVNETVAPATPAIMRAGRTYRLTINADNNTLQYRGVLQPVAGGGMDRLLAGGTNATTVAAVFPLPTTTLVAGATTTVNVPLIIVVGTKPTT